MEITLSTIQVKEVKFKRKEIIENYYAKIFDLISIRWESLLAYMNLKTHIELLEFQVLKLNGEEALMLQLNELVILRKK